MRYQPPDARFQLRALAVLLMLGGLVFVLLGATHRTIDPCDVGQCPSHSEPLTSSILAGAVFIYLGIAVALNTWRPRLH